jgi:hypothetical protein
LFDINAPDDEWQRERIVRKRLKQLAYTDIFQNRNDEHFEQEPGQEAPIRVRVMPRLVPTQEVGEIRRMDQNTYVDGETHAAQRELIKSSIPLPRFQKTYLAPSQYVDGSDNVLQNTGYEAERRALTQTGTMEHCYVGAVTMQDVDIPTHNSGEERDILALGPGEVLYARAANSAPGTDSAETLQDTVKVRGMKRDEDDNGLEATRGESGYDANLLVHTDAQHNARRTETIEAHGARRDDFANSSAPATYDAEQRHQQRANGEVVIPFTNMTQIMLERNTVEPVGTYESLNRRQSWEDPMTGRGDTGNQGEAPHVVQSPREPQTMCSEQTIAYTTLGAMERASQTIGHTRVAQDDAQINEMGARVSPLVSEKTMMPETRAPLHEDTIASSRVQAATSDAAVGQQRREARDVMRTAPTLLQGAAFAQVPAAAAATRDDLQTGARRDTKTTIPVTVVANVGPSLNTGNDTQMVSDAVHRQAKIASIIPVTVVANVNPSVNTGNDTQMVSDAVHRHAKMASIVPVNVNPSVNTGNDTQMVSDVVHRHAKMTSLVPATTVAAVDSSNAYIVSGADGRHMKTEKTASTTNTESSAGYGAAQSANTHIISDTVSRHMKLADSSAASAIPAATVFPHANNAQVISDTVRRHMKIARVDTPMRATLAYDAASTANRAIMAPLSDPLYAHNHSQISQRVSLGTDIDARRAMNEPRALVRQIIETPIGIRINDAAIGHEQQQIGVTTTTDVRGIYQSVQPQPGAMPQAAFTASGATTHEERKTPPIQPRIYNSENTSTERVLSLDRHRTNQSELSPYGCRL